MMFYFCTVICSYLFLYIDVGSYDRCRKRRTNHSIAAPKKTGLFKLINLVTFLSNSRLIFYQTVELSKAFEN